MGDKDKSRASRSAGRWWVVQQHDEFEVLESPERPSTAVKAGERGKAAHGPFASKEDADKRADAIFKQTLRGSHGEVRR